MTLHSRPASPDAVSDVETDHPHILLPKLVSCFIRRGGCWRRSDTPAYSYNADRANCIPRTPRICDRACPDTLGPPRRRSRETLVMAGISPAIDRPLQVLLGLHGAFGFAFILRFAQCLSLIPFALAAGQGDLDLDA